MGFDVSNIQIIPEVETSSSSLRSFMLQTMRKRSDSANSTPHEVLFDQCTPEEEGRQFFIRSPDAIPPADCEVPAHARRMSFCVSARDTDEQRRGPRSRPARIAYTWKRKESGKNGAFVAPGEDWKPFRNRGLDHFLHDCPGN